jgi:hypothetical protein
MIAVPELEEYLDEIRKEACSRCVERPPGGPPCGPLGKPCGVELHLPRLVEAVREVHSECIAPYSDNVHCRVCPDCALLHSSVCPCPMDYLAVLVVQAIEAVDERQRRQRVGALVASLPGGDRPWMQEVARAYEEAAGTWTGCDWSAFMAPGGLDVRGWTSADAEARAAEASDPLLREDWAAVAWWLREVEQRSFQAEAGATRALRAASAGEWSEAVDHARRAWALEFATGRPIRRPPTWQRFYQVISTAARAQAEGKPSLPVLAN